MPRKGVLLAALASLAATPAAANDSTAAFAAGGIQLTKTDAIAMVDEDLAISRDAVRVRYVFENLTGADVETLVAFPLPAIDLATYAEIPINPPDPDPNNFVGFTVSVDGEPVTPTLSMRATLNGKDVTGALKARAVPISLFSAQLYPTLLAMTPTMQAEMEADELAHFEPEYGAVYPQWTQHGLFTWNQVFPAGRQTIVEHAYAPVVGNTMLGDFLLAADDAGEAEWLARYCIAGDTRNAIGDLLDRFTAAGRDRYALVDEIGYVLSTGANWAGPIRHLRITIDVGDPGNLLATCLPGLVRETPTTWAVDLTDHMPTGDLWFLIVRHDPES